MSVLENCISEAMKAYQVAVARLAEVPGVGVDSAQQINPEIGPQAAAFPSAPQLASWIGVCPGRQESARESSRTVEVSNPSSRQVLRPPRFIDRAKATSSICPAAVVRFVPASWWHRFLALTTSRSHLISSYPGCH
jgi:hypothetical protein